MTSFNRWRTVV